MQLQITIVASEVLRGEAREDVDRPSLGEGLAGLRRDDYVIVMITSILNMISQS